MCRTRFGDGYVSIVATLEKRGEGFSHPGNFEGGWRSPGKEHLLLWELCERIYGVVSCSVDTEGYVKKESGDVHLYLGALLSKLGGRLVY